MAMAIAIAPTNKMDGRASPLVSSGCALWPWCWCWWALTNVAFLVVVCWLTAGRDPWWMGPAFSAGYALVWFAVAHAVIWSINKGRAVVVQPTTTNSGTGPNPDSESCPNGNKVCGSCGGVVVTLLVGLAVVGWYVARVAIHCPSDDHYSSSYYERSHENEFYDPTNSVPGYPWTTDYSRLPVNVQDWAATTLPDTVNPMWVLRRPYGGLVYLPGSRTTIISELSSDYSGTMASTIWSVSPTAPQPIALCKGCSGFDFVRVLDDQVCFVTQREMDDESNSDESGDSGYPSEYVSYDFFGDRNAVACTNGTIVTMTATAATTAPAIPIWPNQHRTGPRNLHVDPATGLVWYRDYYFSPNDLLPEPLIYSLDPTTMVETLHSEILDGGHSNDSGAVVQAAAILVASASSTSVSSDLFDHCERRTRAFPRILLAVVITSLPVVVSSLCLWRQQQQSLAAGSSSSSSPPPHHHHLMVLVTLLAGMSALTLVLAYAWSPRNDPYGDKEAFLSWWTMCVGGAVALFCALMMMMDRITKNDKTNNSNNDKMLRWGRNIGALVYLRWGIAAILSTTWSNRLTRRALPWIVFNAVIVTPLTVMGLTAESFFVLLVAATGVLVDAYQLSRNWTHIYRHSPWLVKAMITVVVMGGTGVVVTALLTYWWMRHRHPDLLAVVITHLGAYCAPWWHRRCGTTSATGTTATFTAIPNHDDNDRNDDKFDYQQAPPTTSAATAATEDTAAAASRGMETLADMLRRWADQLDRMRLAYVPESAATA